MKKHIRKLIALLLAGCMLFALAACGGTSTEGESNAPVASDPVSSGENTPTGENTSTGDNVIRIGALCNQTGWFAIYDYNNVLEMQCLAKMINDKGGLEVGGQTYTIEIIAEDGQSDASGIRSAAQLLADAGVDYVVETNDFWVEGALDIFENAGIMNIMAQNNVSYTTINENWDYSYTFSNGAAAQYAAAFELLVRDYPQVKSIVHCENDDGSGEAKAALIKALCEKYGLEFIDKAVIYDAEATDFSAVALQLIATGADAFIGNASVTNAGSILKELRNNGSDMVLAGTIGANASMLKEAAGADASTNAFTMGSDLENPENNTEAFNELYNTFKAEYGDEVASAWCGVGVNCLYVLLELMKDAGSVEVEDVRAYIESAETVESIFGTANICGVETYGVKHIISHPNSTTKLVDGEVVFGGWIDCYVP